jgi:pimeloyl-ACP methyl ester carboxylesterase
MDFPGTKTLYRDFERWDFVVAGVPAIVVAPHAADTQRNWVWRAEFWDHEPGVDLALLASGFHLVHLQVGNTFGCPSAMLKWDEFYSLLTGQFGFAKKVALEGLSRGGLYCYNWAARNPEKVSCIYADNPVCDFKSWPGGKGVGPGSDADWRKLISDYQFASEEEALKWPWNPVDNLSPLARAGIPVLHVCGDADEVVPYPENSGLVSPRYRALGGTYQEIIKPGEKHHPHGLKDPFPVVDFILRSSN